MLWKGSVNVQVRIAYLLCVPCVEDKRCALIVSSAKRSSAILCCEFPSACDFHAAIKWTQLFKIHVSLVVLL